MTQRRVQAGYLFFGLAIGGLWIAHRGEPAWVHAARTLAVLLVVSLTLQVLHRRRPRSRPSSDGTRISLVRLIAAKLLVVAIALVVDWVLQRWIPNADLIVAIGLAVGIAAVGPKVHRYLLVPDNPGR